jgi:hypothetical protein
VSRRSRRTARIAEKSLRDLEWQAEEYERVMGAQKREEQELAANVEKGQCVCRSRVVRSDRGFRTVHEPHCSKYKDWMAEYIKVVNPIAEAHAAAAARTPLRAVPDEVADKMPDFDGATYTRALDHRRLAKQLLRVGHHISDGGWYTLRGISHATGDPEASVSARLRDLRKAKFGGHTVIRERLSQGQFRYRLILTAHARDDEEW